MESNSDIQLVIKSGSQNVEDQIVLCDLDWSVERLKNHISEVYPNKPAVNEQKLIYSGHILQDSSYIKDILKDDEKQATLHLVCNWKNRVNFNDGKFQPSQPVPENSEDSSSSESTGSSTQLETAGSLRQRFGAQPVNVPNPSFEPYWQATPTTAYESYAAQMAAMQQMYSTYYAQYYQNFQSMPQAGNDLSATATIQQNVPILPQRQHEAAPVAPMQAEPPQRNIRINAQGAPELDDNDEFINRDWLDYFYVCCRGFVFISIVYFYSSPERLMIVLGFLMLALIYQEGYVRPRRNARLLANRAGPIPARPPPPAVQQENNSEDAPNTNENQDRPESVPENEIEPIMDAENHPQQVPVATEHQNPAWTFITTFFSSLIPEQPAPVNLN